MPGQCQKDEDSLFPIIKLINTTLKSFRAERLGNWTEKFVTDINKPLYKTLRNLEAENSGLKVKGFGEVSRGFSGFATPVSDHFQRAAERAEAVSRPLGMLMPQLRGPSFAEAVRERDTISPALRGSARSREQGNDLTTGTGVSCRGVSLGLCRGYSSVLSKVSGLLPGVPPVDLQAAGRRQCFQ
ncbi:hypothetical protein RUM44_011822 [Polyplax serrata]|uniref:Uncharacterized protein n=1 Tax=Polyplax serrata TaxID=468196 RepID=A0ABR1B9K6_POLSC